MIGGLTSEAKPRTRIAHSIDKFASHHRPMQACTQKSQDSMKEKSTTIGVPNNAGAHVTCHHHPGIIRVTSHWMKVSECVGTVFVAIEEWYA